LGSRKTDVCFSNRRTGGGFLVPLESANTVTATLATGTLAASWRPIEMAAAELRHECTALDQLVQELFGDLDRVRSELELKADEVEEGRKRLAERGRQLADQRKEVGRLSHQLEQQDSQLREALGELRGLREQLDREREDYRGREAQQTAALHDRLKQMESERDDLRRRCDALQAQVGNGSGGGDVVTPLLNELAELRRHVEAIPAQVASNGGGGNHGSESVAPLMNELVELRRNLDQTRSDLSGAIDRAAASRGDVAAMAGGSPETSERFLTMEKERAELEAELELVRTRAQELQETVVQQKRELADSRDDLQAELKLLRQLIEQQSDLMSAGGGDDRRESLTLTHPHSRTGPAVPLIRPTQTHVDEAPAGADPVVSSVMAQFARLQKDVAQRRQKVKK
jgi:DNA repair exonuclease SbcCD ATPase subunit